jgi:hypothetical protein
MTRTVILPCLLLSLAVAACEKGESATEAAPSASASAPLTDEALDQAAIPVKEDFEDDAEQAINEDNVEEQVDALEKSIEADNL